VPDSAIIELPSVADAVHAGKKPEVPVPLSTVPPPNDEDEEDDEDPRMGKGVPTMGSGLVTLDRVLLVLGIARTWLATVDCKSSRVT
jgi:hypothetical protein